jgi:hypothetical protein
LEDWAVPNYWFDVFTPKTWQEAQAHGLTVSGFSESKYATVQKLQPGDILVCYLKGPMQIIGALRVTGPAYFSRDPVIWESKDFPARIPVEPKVIREPEQALDFRALLPHLSFYDGDNMLRTWARLQGSPTKLDLTDGELLFAALQSGTLPREQTVPPPAAAAPPWPSPLPTAPFSSSAQPVALIDPLETLITQITTAQREAAKPVLFEQAVARAFAFLGFDVTLYGQAGKTDMVIDSPLGHDRFRAVVDAKASSSGKIPENQINWPAIAAHRQQEGADYAVVVGERFAGGNLTKFAADFSIALVDTESLIEVLRLHAGTPFPAVDLRPLFSTAGPVSTVVADLRQKAQTIERHWHLVAEIVRLVDSFSRLDQPPVPTAGNLHAVLVAQSLGSKDKARTPPSEQDVRDALAFLSCRAVGVLRPVEPEAGYRLSMSVHTALQRLRALDGTIRQWLPEDGAAPQATTRVDGTR